MLSEAFRWRLSQNDCQNRGYVLDGYPICYETADQVFFIPGQGPKPKEKKEPAEGEDPDAEPAQAEPEEELTEEQLAVVYALSEWKCLLYKNSDLFTLESSYF